MEKYPQYLLRDPQPLVRLHLLRKWFRSNFCSFGQVFVQGSVDNEPDIMSKLIRVLDSTSIEMTDIKESVNMDFRQISLDHEFVSKKPQKEHINLDGLFVCFSI